MQQRPRQSLVIADLRGGRNGADPPLSLPDNQAVEMLNVDNFSGLVANKRYGASALATTGGTAFSSGINSMFRFVPGAAETAAELWAVDGAATPIVKRLAAGTTWANVTVTDAIVQPYHVNAVTFNGKLYLAYDSTSDFLHVYDPTMSSPRVRRTGFATPGAPTVANSAGGGAYAATARKYRVRWIQKNGSIVERMSGEGTASSIFTPDGAHDAAVVTQPSVPNDGETHWRVEVSLTPYSSWYILSDVVIGTTTYSDSMVTTSYSSQTASASAGAYSNWVSVKYLLTDGNRLLGGGSWETGNKNSRVWFSPVLGSTDEGDAERVPNIVSTQQNWVDLNENDGGYITGMGGPVYGAPYVFKLRQVWKLVPTGDLTTPYLPRKLSDSYGCVYSKSIVPGRDAMGNPCLYFWSTEGPCRIVIQDGVSTIQYLGRDIEDLSLTVNKTNSLIPVHGLYHQDKHQIWYWITTNSASGSVPDTKVVYDVLLGRFVEGERVRGGWYKHTGDSAIAFSSTMFSGTPGATMTLDLKPYIGAYVGAGTAIWKCDDTSVTQDAGVSYQAYVKTKPLPVAPIGQRVGIGKSILLAKAGTSVTITQTINRDFGLETQDSTVSLTADASETYVSRVFEESDLSGCTMVQIQIGDGSAANNTWTLDSLAIPIRPQESRID